MRLREAPQLLKGQRGTCSLGLSPRTFAPMTWRLKPVLFARAKEAWLCRPAKELQTLTLALRGLADGLTVKSRWPAHPQVSPLPSSASRSKPPHPPGHRVTKTSLLLGRQMGLGLLCVCVWGGGHTLTPAPCPAPSSRLYPDTSGARLPGDPPLPQCPQAPASQQSHLSTNSQTPSSPEFSPGTKTGCGNSVAEEALSPPHPHPRSVLSSRPHPRPKQTPV